MTQRRSSSKHILQHHRVLFCSLLLCLFSGADAQRVTNPDDIIEPEARWYQVEVIIFGSTNDPSISPELWPHNINLSYPLNWIELKGFEEPEPPTDEENALTSGENGLLNSDDRLSTGVDTNNATTADAVDATDSDAALMDQSEQDEAPDPLRDIAFHILPEDEFLLANEAKRLERSPNYRVLFHQAWRQPFMENDENVPAILIRGGDMYDDHYELEGTITVSLRRLLSEQAVRRWLHVETNLWLTQFVTNYGQELESWPELPPRPNRRPHLASDLDDDLTTVDSGWWQFRPQSTQYDSVLSKPYVIENIVQMKQARKVQRREELHYLDNPQMGVLVYFTQYDPPQPEPEPAPTYDPVIFEDTPPTQN